MSAPVTLLLQRAETLREELEGDRSSAAAHDRGALRQAKEKLAQEEALAAAKQKRIDEKQAELREINAAVNQLRGTRPITDNPQA